MKESKEKENIRKKNEKKKEYMKYFKNTIE